MTSRVASGFLRLFPIQWNWLKSSPQGMIDAGLHGVPRSIARSAQGGHGMPLECFETGRCAKHRGLWSRRVSARRSPREKCRAAREVPYPHGARHGHVGRKKANGSYNPDLEALSGELATLRNAMRKEAEKPPHDKAVAEVGAAEEAAENGDGASVLQHLKNAGNWALDVATKIGVNVASEALKQSLRS